MQASSVLDRSTGRVSLLVSRSHGHETFTAEYVANHPAAAIITPPATQRVCVCGIFCATDANLGTVALDFAASAIPVWRMYASRFQTIGGTGLHIEGAAGEVLTLTTTTGANAVFLAVNYRFVDD